MRKAKYDLDEAQVKPYFELNSVLQNGVFYAAQPAVRDHLQGAQGHPGVSTRTCASSRCSTPTASRWRCGTATTSSATTRTAARGWSNFVDQSKLLGTLPVVYNVANFPKPAPGEPALISFTDVTTMFHEFGHALHGMFANTEYPRLSGTRRAARLRRVPVAVQRALGAAIRRCSSTTRSTTRPARRCRRSWRRRSGRRRRSTRATC